MTRKWKITELVDGTPVYWIIRGARLIAIVYGEERICKKPAPPEDRQGGVKRLPRTLGARAANHRHEFGVERLNKS